MFFFLFRLFITNIVAEAESFEINLPETILSHVFAAILI